MISHKLLIFSKLFELTLPIQLGLRKYKSQKSKLNFFKLSRYSLISDLVVKRRDESVCFFHPLLREWLMRRGDKESIKFICDPRIGHTALSLEMCRTDQSLTPELTLDLTHHILKSNIYRNTFLSNYFIFTSFFISANPVPLYNRRVAF